MELTKEEFTVIAIILGELDSKVIKTLSKRVKESTTLESSIYKTIGISLDVAADMSDEIGFRKSAYSVFDKITDYLAEEI